MNRLAPRKPFKSPIAGKQAAGRKTAPAARSQTAQSFQEMIQWRREREKKERLDRNKKLMNTLKTDINPRFQLADIRAFTLPALPSSAASLEWSDLGLRPDLTQALVEGLKLKQPLPAQVSVIPAILKLKTGLFAAPTGCGKTLAYLLPLFQHLKNEEEGANVSKGDLPPFEGEPVSRLVPVLKSDLAPVSKSDLLPVSISENRPTAPDQPTSTSAQDQPVRKLGPRAVILVPTHELVRQVYSVAKALSHYAKLRVETTDTVFKFKRPEAAHSLDILVTTPRSFLRNQSEGGPFKIKTGALKRVVVDEADTLFSAEFAVEVKQIISLNSQVRVLATSATITRQLQKTLTGLFPDTKIHMTAGLHATLPALRQRFLTIHQPGNAKMKEALRIISEEPTSKIIFFCNKLVKAEALHQFLCDSLISVDADIPGKSADTANANANANVLPALFHGNLPPVQRASIISKFASGEIRVLISTDLAARGLDTPSVNHVVNFDFPRSLQDYLHRVGRTARAGRGGAVTSFVTGKDRKLFEYIELAAKQRRILSDPL